MPCGLLVNNTDRAGGAADRHGFFAGGEPFYVGAFNGHAPRGQKFIAQRQAKRRPGYNVLWSLRPVSAKILKQSVLYLLLPLQGVV